MPSELSGLFQLTLKLSSFMLTFGTLPSELREPPTINQSHPYSPAIFCKITCVTPALRWPCLEAIYSLELIKQFHIVANRYPDLLETDLITEM